MESVCGPSPKKDGTVIAKMSPGRGAQAQTPIHRADCETELLDTFTLRAMPKGCLGRL